MLLSSKQKNGNRLEFDNQLTSDLSKYAQRTRRAIPVFTITLCAMLLLALAVWASQTVQMPSWSWFRNNGNLDKICLDIAEALRSGSVTQPLPDCADSEQGITVLQQENVRLFRDKSAKPVTTAPAPFSAAFLASVREDLAAQGAPCDQIRPLAFGGIQAKVMESKTMRQAARSINGELYLLCGDKVYAIELTARRCGDQFVVTRFWQYRLVNTEPGKVREAAQEVIRGFNQEKAEMPQNVEVKGARQVYLELKS